MIKVTRVGKQGGYQLINAEEIEVVQPQADGSVLIMRSGNKFRVAESIEEVQRLVLAYKRAIFAQHLDPTAVVPTAESREEDEVNQRSGDAHADRN